jgi:type I restriction enzyme M protein
MASQEYNLNIPRYVDTFEAEDSIDINAIANEIKALDTQIEETDKAIAIFCAELGIETPF